MRLAVPIIAGLLVLSPVPGQAAAAHAAAGRALAGRALAGQATATVSQATAADGASVVAEQQVDARTLDLTIASPDASGADVSVRLLLPPGWSATASQTWPVLYLLHGCCDAYTGWETDTNVATVTQGAPVIVALPDGGPGGLYADWWNFGRGGENYEDFIATELPQILRNGFRASTVQAIGGVSTGGGAALFIAASHPGAYTAVASYSGMDCTELPSSIPLIDAVAIEAGALPDDLWGDPFFQRSIWAASDPCDLASSLRGTSMFLSVGNGLTSSGGSTTCAAAGNILESAVALGVYAFATKLSALGIGYTSDFYSGGCHSWPYWQTEFDKSWPMLESALGA